MITHKFYVFSLQIENAHAALVARGDDDSSETIIICQYPYITKQLARVSDRAIREELEAAGYWKGLSMEARDHNERRIVWLACMRIVEKHKRIF